MKTDKYFLKLISLIDKCFDRRLKIDTCGEIILDQKKTYADYEPTPYIVLYMISKKIKLKKNDHLLDIGCGKGRVLIYFANKQCKKITGIECNAMIYDFLKINIQQSLYYNQITIVNEPAEYYDIPFDSSIFFLFNTFYVTHFIEVLVNLCESIRTNPRDCTMVLYSPAENLVDHINTIKEFKLTYVLPPPLDTKLIGLTYIYNHHSSS